MALMMKVHDIWVKHYNIIQ